MDSFPLFLKLKDRLVLLAGGGEAALAKFRLLSSAGASVRVVSPLLIPSLQEAIAVVGAELRLQAFAPRDLENVDLVFIAIEDEAQAREVAIAAQAAGKFVNAVDRPVLCNFTMPAIVDRGDVVVAISSAGASPVLSQKIRAAIEDLLPQRLGHLARLTRRFRKSVASRIAKNGERRDFWHRVIDGPIGRKVLQGDEIGASRDLLRLLNGEWPGGEKGWVFLLDLPLDLELLTLKSLRRLREADVLVHEGRIDDAIWEYCRRDARRMLADEYRDATGAWTTGLGDFMERSVARGEKIVFLKAPDTSGDTKDILIDFLGKTHIAYEALAEEQSLDDRTAPLPIFSLHRQSR